MSSLDTTHSQRYGYEKVAADIRAKIVGGVLLPGSDVPSLDVLVEQYDYSRMTVFKALRQLADEGYISMGRGRRTRVRQQPVRPAAGFVSVNLLDDGCLNGFPALVARAFQRQFHERGWSLRLYADCPFGESGQPPWDLIEALSNRRLQALITTNSNLPYNFLKTDEWQKLKVPHIDVGTVPSKHWISLTATPSMALVVAECRRRGIQSMGVISPPASEQFASRFDSAGLTLIDDWCVQSPVGFSHEEGGYAIMQMLWRKHPRPDAIYITDDILAKGVFQALLALGADIPNDLLIFYAANEGAQLFMPLPAIRVITEPTRIATEGVALLDKLAVNPDLPTVEVPIVPRLDTGEVGD